MNITDVEDKIIKRVRENKTTLREFTGKYETAFLDDLKTLNCHEPHVKPRATEYIAEIIALIEKLDRARHRLQSRRTARFISPSRNIAAAAATTASC